jgi:hypothetical protein
MAKEIHKFSETPVTEKSPAKEIDPALKLDPGSTAAELLEHIIQLPEDALLPLETVELPSHGQFYGWPSGLIKVRPIGTMAEQALLNQRTAATGENIDNMIKACCEFPQGFDPSDLIVGDTTYLIYYIRGISYGKDYEFIMQCPHCNESSTYSYDLSNLSQFVRYAKQGMVEPVEIVLPDISERVGREVTVGLRFTRRSDMITLLARKKSLSKATGIGRASKPGTFNKKTSEDNTALILANVDNNVVSVLGNSDLMKIREVCNRLSSADRQTIRDWLKDNTPGLDATVEVNCPSCDEVSSIALPVTESFFRKKKPARV